MSATVTRIPAFRKYKSRDEPSWAPVIAVAFLIAFNVGIWGYIFLQLWRFSR